MAKYKVGDKVRIVNHRTMHMSIFGGMDKWLGKTMTIRTILPVGYHMVEDRGENCCGGWYWYEDMIAGLAEPERKPYKGGIQMSAREATPAEITAMKERLAKRQEERRFDADADQAINLVHRRKPVVVEERATALEKREYVVQAIPAGRAFSWAACAVILARAVSENILFLLVLGLAVFGAAAVM